MGSSIKPLFHRNNTLANVSNSNFQPSSSYTICVLPRGAQVNGNQSAVTSITVFRGHDFAVNQKFMVNLDETTLRTVTATTATTVDFSGALTVVDGDKLVNLGNDSGTTSPAYDSTSVVMYSSLNTTSALSQSERTTSSTGGYEYWSESEVVWELVLDSDGDPDTIIRDIQLDRVDSGILSLKEITDSHNTAPVADGEVQMYTKADNMVWKVNDNGTTRYYFFDLNSSSNPTLSHSTTEPS